MKSIATSSYLSPVASDGGSPNALESTTVEATRRAENADMKPIIEKHIEFWYGRGLNERDDEVGATPFIDACEKGDEASVFLLLVHVAMYLDANDEGVDLPNANSNNLQHVCDSFRGDSNHRGCFNNGSHRSYREEFVNVKDDCGHTALHELAARGHDSILRIVLGFARRHCIRLDVHARDDDCSTALHFAAKNGHESIISMLLEYNRERKDSSRKGASCSCIQENRSSILTAKDNDGWTAMHFAVSNNHMHVVQMLIDAIMKPESTKFNSPNNVTSATADSNTATVNNDLQRMVNASESINGRTPLHLAALNGFAPIVNTLLSNGADIHARETRNHRTALLMAASWCQEECMRLLLESGASIDDQDNHGFTALQISITNGAKESIIRLLLDHGASDGICGQSRGLRLQLVHHLLGASRNDCN